MGIKINGAKLKPKVVDKTVKVEVEIKNLVKKVEKIAQKPKRDHSVKKIAENGKFSMSYSRLRSYLSCPKKFEYHTKYGWNPSPETKKIMRGGLIFEAVVFGDKNGVLEGANSKTDLNIIEQAFKFKENNLFGEGEAYVNVSFENEYYKTRGEVDFLGEYKFTNGRRRAIVDLKYTGKIDFIWQGFKYKEDALQVIMYSWMHWKNTGEKLDGVYLVVESSYDDPVYSPREVFISEDDYKWLEKFLFRVALEPIKVTSPSRKNCLGKKGVPRCPYLQYCKSGRAILGGVETYDVGLLPSKTDTNINF